jgi:UDP-N-acetylglucosamine acyltransferase
MPVDPSAKVHPTAIVSAEADLGPGVEVGPYTVIEGPVTLGPNCLVGPHVHLIGPIKMGQGNKVGTGSVIGGEPQHLAYKGQPTSTEVGDNNIFREHVTIHRGSHVEGVTRIGNNNYLMAHTHVAHDCHVANHCIMVNGSLLAGHCRLEDRVIMSGGSAIQQFVRVGRLSMISGHESATKDVIPFVIVGARNVIAGVNSIGLKRAGFTTDEILAVRKAFHLLYRSGLMLKLAIDRVETELADIPVVAEIVRFIRTTQANKRSIVRPTKKGGVGEDE